MIKNAIAGMKVRVKSVPDLLEGASKLRDGVYYSFTHHQCSLTKPMLDFSGKLCTITSIAPATLENRYAAPEFQVRYYLSVDGQATGYSWVADWLELEPVEHFDDGLFQI